MLPYTDKKPLKRHLLHESSALQPETEAMGTVLPGLSSRPGHRWEPAKRTLLPGPRTHGNRQL